MERLSFSSAEDLDAYCERVRADLSSRSDEQRQLVQAALERLDLLAAQADVIHSSELAAEIQARREEGIRMLARLGGSPQTAAAEPAVAVSDSATPAVEPIAIVAGESFPPALENGHSALEPASLNGDVPLDATEPSAGLGDPDPQPSRANLADTAFPSATPALEALWQQPVDPFPAPEAAPSQAFEDFSRTQSIEAAPPAFPLASAAAEPDLTEAHAPEPDIAFGAPVLPEPTPVAPIDGKPAPAASELPAALNWAWGAESESPAWAALLVEDAPVPMEPLTDSHFVHAPPASEITGSTPEAPSTPPAKAGELQQLVLNVKVGEWGSEHPLSKPELLVGRRDLGTRCMPDVEVMYDQAVSRRHLRIARDNGSYVVEDLNSTNGTTLNGHSLKPGHPEKIKAGDELEIGEFTLLKIAAV